MSGKRVSFSQVGQDSEKDTNDREDSQIDDDDTAEDKHSEGRQFNKFELLGLVEGADDQDYDAVPPSDDEQISSDDADNVDSKLNNKKNPSNQPMTSNGSKRKPRKKRGKNSKGAKQNKNRQDFDIEELDNISKAIVLHSSANLEPNNNDNSRFKLLKVDMRNLIPESELKRIFGKSVIKEDKSNRLRQHPGSNLQRSRFVSSGYFDSKSTISGPKMDLDEAINNVRRSNANQQPNTTSKINTSNQPESSSSLFTSDEPIYFKFVHDKAYQEAQKMFLLAVDQGTPESIVQNLTIAPFHAESLIQLSHMIRVSEDYKTASEFIERAIIIFEKGFHPRFNLATANCRITYKRPENRTFFIAIFKHINYCHRRGLRKTPFEYSKLLLSLEPENDPLLAVQLLDFFAIRSEEYDYLINFYFQWEKLQKLPNLNFSLALAYFLKSRLTKESKEENVKNLSLADKYLQKALLLFPNFIIPLLDACSAEPDAELKKCSYFDYSVYSNKYKLVPETIDVLMNLYVKRSFCLWKQKHVMSWLEKNVSIMVEQFKCCELHEGSQNIEHWNKFVQAVPKNLLRHIVLCDLDIKIPSSASSSTFLDIDPYPPTDSIVSYSLNSTTSGLSQDGSSFMGGMSSLFLRSFLPSFSLSDQQPASASNQQNTTTVQQQRQRQRRVQSSTQTSNATNQGLQISIGDYVIDDNEDVSTIAGGEHGSHFNELQSTIRDLANTVSNLLSVQSTIRSHQEPTRDATNLLDDEENNHDDDANEQGNRSDQR